MKRLIYFAVLICSFQVKFCHSKTLVVRSTEESAGQDRHLNEASSKVSPQIYSMDILTNVSNRFATTLITSKVKNFRNVSTETTFAVVLPKNAFVSEFSMEIEDKIYKAYVKEKEEANQIYEKAKSEGASAAKVEVSARDSNTFTVSVNIEPESKTIFRLTYEELLQRELDMYEVVLNIHPGQIVDDLNIEVHIEESRPLKFVKTPSLRTGNEISKNENEKLDPLAHIETVNGTSAIVKFKPNQEQQRQFAQFLNVENKEEGIKGQFVVQYDVERDPQGGEVLVEDGYFVHFFAPSDLEPLPKHVVFVLDHSGSMKGSKFAQLIAAMQNILSELRSDDVFNMIFFSAKASVWDNKENVFQEVNVKPDYGNLEPLLREEKLPGAVEVTKDNIEKAKAIIKNEDNMWDTNIIEGLEVGLFLLNNNNFGNSTKTYQKMIIFLTDGYANGGVRDRDEIIKIVTKLNQGSSRTSIYSLSFGDNADKNFLRKLSESNLGFSRHIYEAADASLQLENFYKKISSPLLFDVQFKYVDGVSQVTKQNFPMFFQGSELVFAGKTSDHEKWDSLYVNAHGQEGHVLKLKPRIEQSSSTLERLWAYLTVKQLLEESKNNVTNEKNLKNEALELSLKYSFVTEVTSLVVVKPNATSLQEERPATSFHNNYQIGKSSFVPARGWRPGAFRRRSKSRVISNKRLDDVVPQTFPLPISKETLVKEFQYKIDRLTNGTKKLTTAQGTFDFGGPLDQIAVHPDCPKTPLNGTGVCTSIFDCPLYFPLLNDLNVILDHFCPLDNQRVGVCCPKNSSGNATKISS